MSRYLEFDHPIVMNAEVNCWPDANRASQYPNKPATAWRYLNSGCYVADRQALYETMNPYMPAVTVKTDDQRFFTNIFLEHPDDIRLDEHCKLFQTFYHCADKVRVTDGQMTNTVTGTNPLIAHFNGNAEGMEQWPRSIAG
jgi:hypothetical protein